ncbi:MAG: DUF1993 domain-containing protein [Steroidobacteraceae bacterium]|nr:DUF1993 domain-containing protein [Steroidobacteraceae bacterium]
MKVSMYGMSIALFTTGLQQLDHILGKAEANAKERSFAPEVLLAARLAPDMFALDRQVQLTCDFAKNSGARLAGIDPPRFEDNEKTLVELRARATRTLEFLATLTPATIDDSETREIKIPLRDRTLEYPGLAFLQKWALPNFYFHLTTVYDILRHNGVDLGKRDYLGDY